MQQPKRFLYLLFLTLALVSTGCRSTAQVIAPIEESGGKAYYMHTVEKGQTLYAISRTYKCDMNDILAANPGSDAGIREGQVLKIPVEKSKVDKVEVKTSADGTFIMHEVQKKETLFSIARQYNIDVNALTAANPGSDQGIRKGQVLRIPVKPAPKAPETGAANTRLHTVAAGETLYAISRQYGVPVDAILSANPGMGETLSVGQVIKVPTRALPVEEEKKPSLPEPVGGKVEISGPLTKEKYSIALMMPFMTNEVDTIGLSDKEKRLRDVALHFYRGGLMAVDTLAREGLNADLYVYDVVDDKAATQRILQKNEMKSMDLIIGPAFRDPLAEVSTWGEKNGVHVVCPVPQSNKVLLQSENMSKAYPSEVTMWESLGRYIGKVHGRDNVIVINTTDVDDLKLLSVFTSSFQAVSGDTATEFKTSNGSCSGLAKLLRPTGKNIVVVPSDDRLLITTLFKNLSGDNVIVYGTSNWENLELIDTKDRNQYHLHYPKAVWVDYSDPTAQDWIEAYRRKFKSEPDEYALLGYDIMLYYGRGLRLYGRDFPNHFASIPANGIIGTGFDLFRTGNESGFENRYLIVLGTEEFVVSRKPNPIR